MTMDNVFVTGANGLLGTNLVLMLLGKGFGVVALVRRKGSFVNPELKNLHLLEGDLLSKDKLNMGICGCRYVVHVAANTSQNLLSMEDYSDANVTGTRNIIEACIKNNVEKLVYIGTANTYGYGSISDPGNEELPMRSPFTMSFYAMSKKQAQDIVDKASSELNVTTISPTFMMGPFSKKNGSAKLLHMALDKRVVFYPGGGKNFVYVGDVARAIIKAFDLKESGQKFLIANENLTYREFFKKVAEHNRQKTVLILIPNLILRFAGRVGDLCRFLKIPVDFSSVNTKILTVKNFYSNDKAKKNLGMDFTPLDQVLDDIIAVG